MKIHLLGSETMSIPAASAPSEKVFSVAGIVVDKCRCALTANMIIALVFLHKDSSLLSLTDEFPVRPESMLILPAQGAEDSDLDDDDDLLGSVQSPVQVLD